MIESNSTELIEHQTIAMIVDNVEQAKIEVAKAFEMLQAAKTRLHAALGDSRTGYYHTLIPNKNHYGDTVFEDSALADSHKMITQNAWRYILDQTGLKHYMTEKRQKELYEQIEKNELPPLTVENIIGTLQGLAGKVDGLLMESVREVFDWLRPRKNRWANAKSIGDLKTNHEWHVGPKVIIGWAIERNYGGGYHINYHRDANFRALGNVFSLLDGKGVLKYPNDFYSRFNEYFKGKTGDTYTDNYFECKCFGNGNMHVKFKRLDLVAKLNQMGSNGELPGEE